ncbi:MAG: glycosyltransferase WbuB [Gallionellaceae bacterium]
MLYLYLREQYVQAFFISPKVEAKFSARINFVKILIHGINFAPELTGIGKYSGEMAEWFASRGHEVRVVTAPPYYPQWRIAEGYVNRWYKEKGEDRKQKGGLIVYRCPLWVPSKPSGVKRLLHLASFALASFPLMLSQLFWRPDVVMVIEPPLMCAPAALLLARLSAAKSWLHIQDFEVDAAFDMGMLKSNRLRKLVLSIEHYLMRSFDRVSTISPKMLGKLQEKKLESGKTVLFPNWVDSEVIFPLNAPSPMRAELGIADNKIVALYSGNMGEKQGLEVVLEAAKHLALSDNIQFVLCGEGAAKQRLRLIYSALTNVLWLPLQPFEKLNNLLNMADIHLLPQRADVADLVMPSRLTGMLASGCPVVATANAGTQVSEVVVQCGIVVAPGDANALAQAVIRLGSNETMRTEFGKMARAYALANLEKNTVLTKFEEDVYDAIKNAKTI